MSDGTAGSMSDLKVRPPVPLHKALPLIYGFSR